MFELFDEWRGKTHRHPDEGPQVVVGPHDESSGPDTGPGPAVEAFGACPVCAGPRYLRTEPVAGMTSRLALVCDGCGTRTDI